MGGGPVAYRKAADLLKAGARVRVVAPHVTGGLKKLRQGGRIRLDLRPYRKSDLRGTHLVYAATDDPVVNRRIFRDTRDRHILVNVVDAPAYCDFIMPAVLRKGRITIAVSTDGAAPFASVLVKKRIDKFMGHEYIELINTVINVRTRLLSMKKKGIAIDIERALDRLSMGKLARFIRQGNRKAVRTYLDGFLVSVQKGNTR